MLGIKLCQPIVELSAHGTLRRHFWPRGLRDDRHAPRRTTEGGVRTLRGEAQTLSKRVKAVRAGHDPNLASLTETSRSTKHSRSSSPLTLLETLLYGAAVSPQRPVVEHQNIGFFRSIYRLISSDRVGESDLSPSKPGLGLFKRPQSDGRWPSLHRLPTDWRSVDRPASALRPAPTRSLL